MKGLRFWLKDGRSVPPHAYAIINAFSEAKVPIGGIEAIGGEVPEGALLIKVADKPLQ
jgi:hypothetical protein